jgi:hypothetical protein
MGIVQFADDILMASYAKRDGRKITLLDDLKSPTRSRSGEAE